MHGGQSTVEARSKAGRGTNNSKINHGAIIYASYAPGTAITVWIIGEDGEKTKSMSDKCEIPYCTIKNEDHEEVCASEYKCNMVMNDNSRTVLIVFVIIIGLIIVLIIMRLTWNRNQWANCRKAFARCCCGCCFVEKKEKDEDDRFRKADSFY